MLFSFFVVQQIVLLTSCNLDENNLNSSEVEFEQSNEGQNQLSTSGAIRENSHLTTNLTSLIPLTKENFKYWLPNELGHFRKIDIVAGHLESVNVSGVQAHYVHRKFQEKQICIEIVDGAGPIASVFLEGAIQKLEWDYEELNENGFSRIIEWDGVRVWEKENGIIPTSEMEFVRNGRFHFSVQADQLSIRELREFVDGIPGMESMRTGFQVDSLVR